MAHVTPLTLVLAASIAIGAAAAILAWRARPEPGAVPLVGLLAGQSWWSTCLIFQLRAPDAAGKLLWTELAWFGVVAIPVSWLLFALEYTGRDRYVTPRTVAALAVVPAATVALALSGQYHDLLYAETVTGSGGVVSVEQGGPWYWVVAGYTYLLGVLGMVPLVGLITSDAVAFRGQGAALLAGLFAPWLTNAGYLAGVVPTLGVDPTPVGFAVSGVLFLGALTRFRLFGVSPAPNTRARQLVFDRMQEGAVVVDSNDYVVDLNESGASLLETDPVDALGRAATDVVPEYDRLPDDGALDGHLDLADGAYDVTVTRIDNARGNPIGRVLTFHDVSELLRQQQRLTVLNRVLRHNVRTETNLIHGYADRLGDGPDVERVKARAARIEELGEKGRDAIATFEAGRGAVDGAPLADLIDEALATVREAHPQVAVDVEGAATDAHVATHLDIVLENLVENAAEHNAGEQRHVWVDASVGDGRATVTVADDGPGIDQYELGVLRGGTETPLEHGSGLGLWVVRWGVEVAGGEVRFAERTGGGTAVTVEVPVLEDEGPATERDAGPA